MARPPRPALYRIARAISLVATVLTLVIIAYVGLTIYSASHLRPDIGGGNNNGNNGGQGNGTGNGPSIQTTLQNGALDLSLGLNFSNPGFLPISSVHLASVVDAPNNTSRIAVGTSPNVSIPAGSVGVIVMTIVVPFSADSPILAYLTHSVGLPTEIWANVTVSSFFSIGVNISTTYQWGAPFAGLNVTPDGVPASGGSGQVLVPLSISFSNAAAFALDGTLALTASGSGGCTATVSPIPLDVPSGGNFQQVVQASAPSSCASADWTTIGGTYTSSLWNAAIPPEAIG